MLNMPTKHVPNGYKKRLLSILEISSAFSIDSII